MRRQKKEIILTYSFRIIFILVLTISSLSTNVHANESQLPEAPIFIDGQPITTKYMMRGGQLLVPAIFLKHSGAYVDWNEQYKSIVFRVKDTMFALPVGKNYSDDYIKEENVWKRSPLPTVTIEFNGEPFVPLVDVARKLGMSVHYDSNISRTFIRSNIVIKPNTIMKGNKSEKLVALTFDDGPEKYYTPQILDILKEKGVPATFFVMGKQIKAFPEEMKRIVNENHGIANHTWNHPNLTKTWTATVREEIMATQREMERLVGRKPDIFRPPFGAITKSDIAVLNELGMRNIMWSVDTLDWSGLTGDEIVNIVLRDISPGGIILQHNFQSNARLLDGTVEALPKIIEELQAKGYKFVTVQTLLAN
jgi:peptidoglycan-N-acetylglucosamine deacetylase